jgi:hypothetical protein
MTARVVQHTDDGATYPTMLSLEIADGADTNLNEAELRRLAAWLLERADDLAWHAVEGAGPGRLDTYP